MDQVIVFDKSLQQRLQEYTEVLAGYEVLPASRLEKEWGFFLDLTMDPNGWQAIWKIQRKTCEALDIPFPCIVLVLVLDLDIKSLSALVRVLAVQDDIHLPDKHYVPFKQLWPTKEQDPSIGLNLQATANVLDMFRFFYNNLFMPWDYEDDDTIDWKTKHLESRLRLYYDIKNGVIPRVTAEHVHSLIAEAKRLQIKQESLESDLDDFDEANVNVNNNKIQALTELHIRLMEIRGEIDILENPLLREAVIKKHKQMFPENNELKQNIWIIYNNGTASDCIQFLTQVEKSYPNDVLKFSPHLCATLDYANPNDIIILNEGTHMIKTTGALENGGVLKGLSSKEKTVLTSNMEDIMLDFRGDSVLIENMTIKAESPQCAIIVRRGELTLNNCKLIGDGCSSTHQGIIVLGGGKLNIINCEISKFYTAVVGNSDSVIRIESSEVYDCNFGLKLYDNSTMNATKVTIRNCKDYGICMETGLKENEPKIGGFETLNIIPTFQIGLVKGDSNVKGDAVICQKPTLMPVANLFENPDCDPTICYESDEEMESQQNTTVIENICNGRISPASV